jgi:hypothetical protein
MAEYRYPSCQKRAPRDRTEGQIFRALQGHKVVAGGNAPGMREVRSPTLKGSHKRRQRFDARLRKHC